MYICAHTHTHIYTHMDLRSESLKHTGRDLETVCALHVNVVLLPLFCCLYSKCGYNSVKKTMVCQFPADLLCLYLYITSADVKGSLAFNPTELNLEESY